MNEAVKEKKRSEQKEILITFRHIITLCVLICALSSTATTQRIAIIEPEPNGNEEYVDLISESLREKGVKVMDRSAAFAAYSSSELRSPFNLSSEEAKQIGAAAGCDQFILIKTDAQRRSSFQKKEYYEATAFIYVVSSRTGKLVKWLMFNNQNDTQEKALNDIVSSIPKHALEIKNAIEETNNFDKQIVSPSDPKSIKIEVLDEVSADDKSFRAPIPFKRIKPVYTQLAYLFSITATIDAEVDIDSTGSITRLEIVRWAGYGLDESVSDAIRAMNWRPAERSGKTLPMRVLLRYNFKKLDKEDQDSPQ